MITEILGYNAIIEFTSIVIIGMLISGNTLYLEQSQSGGVSFCISANIS